MLIKQIDKNLLVYDIGRFSLPDTLDCGQAFRWSRSYDGSWQAVVNNRLLRVTEAEGGILLYNCTEQEFADTWAAYFDFGRDYDTICAEISVDPILKKAADICGGIHLLRQSPWETLCSFIISQNNNIPRIKGIIDRLCQNFGEKIEGGHTFPTPQAISKLTIDDLAPLRSGFRAKYILDAAKKVAEKTVDLDSLYRLSTDEARNELMKINGVGPKVADCVLLFAYGKLDAFPQDVWIKRTMQTLFGGELPEVALPYAGIVQQILFHYARNGGLKEYEK